jgi:hypothetical protein
MTNQIIEEIKNPEIPLRRLREINRHIPRYSPEIQSEIKNNLLSNPQTPLEILINLCEHNPQYFFSNIRLEMELLKNAHLPSELLKKHPEKMLYLASSPYFPADFTCYFLNRNKQKDELFDYSLLQNLCFILRKFHYEDCDVWLGKHSDICLENACFSENKHYGLLDEICPIRSSHGISLGIDLDAEFHLENCHVFGMTLISALINFGEENCFEECKFNKCVISDEFLKLNQFSDCTFNDVRVWS